MQFEADTIREAKENAGDKIEQNERLSTKALNLDWTIPRDREMNFNNFIVRVYHRGEDEREPLEFPSPAAHFAIDRSSPSTPKKQNVKNFSTNPSTEQPSRSVQGQAARPVHVAIPPVPFALLYLPRGMRPAL